LDAVLALLHLILVGMVIYLRLGPFERVLTRLTERGAEIPAWLPLTFNAGVILVTAFLLWRGGRLARKALLEFRKRP
jgi:hypothetical protein